MILTTLSDLPLLLLLRCRKINCCYIYNVHYYLQRCRLVALSPLFSSLFRCDSVCCFLYTYGMSASNISLYISHLAPYLLPSTILCILYNTISIYSPQTTLVFYNRAMLYSTHHIHSLIFSYQRQTMIYLPSEGPQMLDIMLI